MKISFRTLAAVLDQLKVEANYDYSHVLDVSLVEENFQENKICSVLKIILCRKMSDKNPEMESKTITVEVFADHENRQPRVIREEIFTI